VKVKRDHFPRGRRHKKEGGKEQEVVAVSTEG
jgi:hypothetical protein